MAENSKPISNLNLVAIFCIFFVTMGYTIVTPAMEVFSNQFPDNDYTQISTLPMLFVVIASFIVGAVAGKKVKFRTLAIVGSFLALVGGCAPAWIDSFYAVLACRAVFGLGLGLMIPLANSLIIGNYDGDKQSALLGYGSLIMNAGGIVLQMLGGVLADISAQSTYYAHFFYIAALVLAFFIPEARKVQPVAEHEAKKKVPLSKTVWIIGLLLLIYNMLQYPIMMNMSTIFIDRAAGGAAMAATALSLFTVFGCIGGLVFGKVFQKASRFVLPLIYLLTAVGAFLIVMGETAAVMSAGLCLCGFGFGLCIPAFMAWVSLVTTAENSAAGASTASALLYLGGFLASYWLMVIAAACGESLYSPIWIELVISVIMMIVFLIFNPYKKGKKDEAEAQAS